MSQQISLIEQVRNRRDTVMVPMNQVKIVYWLPRSTTRVLATEGLNGCTGLGIVSSQAGILARVAPLASTQTTDFGTYDPGKANLVAQVQRVIGLYNGNRAAFANSQSFIVIAVFQGTAALPEHLKTIKAVLERLNLTYVVKMYDVLAPGAAREFGWTLIVITSEGDGTMPDVSVNGSSIR